MNMAIIDMVFLFLIVILVIRCALKGFIAEVMNWAAVVLGLLAAVLLHKPGAAFIRTKILEDVVILPESIAFASLMVIVFLFVKIVQHILEDIISRVNLGGLNHALGLVFGFLEGLALVSLLLFVINIQPLFNPESLLEHSFFVKLLDPLVGELRLPVPPLEGVPQKVEGSV